MNKLATYCAFVLTCARPLLGEVAGVGEKRAAAPLPDRIPEGEVSVPVEKIADPSVLLEPTDNPLMLSPSVQAQRKAKVAEHIQPPSTTLPTQSSSNAVPSPNAIATKPSSPVPTNSPETGVADPGSMRPNPTGTAPALMPNSIDLEPTPLSQPESDSASPKTISPQEQITPTVISSSPAAPVLLRQEPNVVNVPPPPMAAQAGPSLQNIALPPTSGATPASPTAISTITVFQRRPSGGSPLSEFPSGPEVAIILAQSRFYPSRIRLKAGEKTRLVFATVNRKPAALVMEQFQVQRWVAASPVPHQPWEITRELSIDRLTEIIVEPTQGSYSFHDALSGAVGEIIVE